MTIELSDNPHNTAQKPHWDRVLPLAAFDCTVVSRRNYIASERKTELPSVTVSRRFLTHASVIAWEKYDARNSHSDTFFADCGAVVLFVLPTHRTVLGPAVLGGCDCNHILPAV